MHIDSLGTTLLLRLSRRELHRQGMEPEALSLRDVLHLCRTACRREGLPPALVSEAEVYPERSGVMVFLHLRGEDGGG